MKHRNRRFNSNSRARAKHIKCVRVRCLKSRSTKDPNADVRRIVVFCRSTSAHSTKTSVPLKAVSTSTKSKCSQKASRRRQSVEVLKNVPTTESTFSRFSTEIRHNLRCHMAEEMTLDIKELYEELHLSPCVLVHECLECIYFHDDFFNILNYRKI